MPKTINIETAKLSAILNENKMLKTAIAAALSGLAQLANDPNTPAHVFAAIDRALVEFRKILHGTLPPTPEVSEEDWDAKKKKVDNALELLKTIDEALGSKKS